MAIDYVIDYKCYPKQELGTDVILERLKNRERAEAVIRLFRESGDERHPSKMGFEFTRSMPAGGEEAKVIVVQDLLDEAAELEPFAPYCHGCPANRTGQPFGCVGFIQYPLSAESEHWLLKQLPTPEEPLIWLLLQQGIQEFGYDGEDVTALRRAESPYFQTADLFMRQFGEFNISSNQVFEMLFLLGHIQPNHGGVLLLLFNAIARDLEADQIMHMSPAPEDAFQQIPFALTAEADEDNTIAQFKQFFLALYLAWGLNVQLILDV